MVNFRSIHLWDLSEEPTWRDDVANEEKPTELVEIKGGALAEFEKVREWNKSNSCVGLEGVSCFVFYANNSHYTRNNFK